MTLPAGWRTVCLGDVAETALGKMLDRGRGRGSQVRYLRNVNVQWGRIDTHDLRTMNIADDERLRFGVEPGDLLVCEGGEIGRAAIWKGDGSYVAFQKALHRIRPGDLLDSTFARYALEDAATSGVLSALSTGSTIAHLPQQQLRRVPLHLPPPEEQRRIVEILEEHLSRLGAASVALENARKRMASFRAATDTALVLRADEKLLGDLTVEATYGTSTKCLPGAAGVPVVRIPNIVDGRVDLRDEKRAIDLSVDLTPLILAKGDVLIIRTNGSRGLIGRSAVVDRDLDASFASYLIRYRVDERRIRPEWLNFVLGLPRVRRALETRAASSAGQYNLSLGKLVDLPLPLPSLIEQDRILSSTQEARAVEARQRRALLDEERRADALRRALLHAAFSGQLTGHPSDLDRAEELASA